MAESEDISGILRDWRAGDDEALERMMPLVYDHLKRIARRRLREERPGRTLNTTGLVHEAYLRLRELTDIDWQDRDHFYAMASRLMRRILVNHAHRRLALKRGGGVPHEPLHEDILVMPLAYADALAGLDEALTLLESLNQRQARILEHRYFGGLTIRETAAVMGLSERTVSRETRFARAWLADVLGGES